MRRTQSTEFLGAYGTEKTVIGRMPARKDYPFKELYWQVKPLISKGKYAFVRKKASVLRLQEADRTVRSAALYLRICGSQECHAALPGLPDRSSGRVRSTGEP